MSRYTGPRVKVMRALGVDLPGLSRKSIERRPYPPGEHGKSHRRKESVYGIQLKEKQKLKINYGLTERQMRRLVKKARRSKLTTGNRMLQLLESRLDNVVFRSGFAPTMPSARQLVNHGHFMVNGRRVDIASYQVRPGDVLSLRERSQKLDVIKTALEMPSLTCPEWLEVDQAERTAKISKEPSEESVPFPVDVQLVVEYYAKRI